jgi:hypothetical protein
VAFLGVEVSHTLEGAQPCVNPGKAAARRDRQHPFPRCQASQRRALVRLGDANGLDRVRGLAALRVFQQSGLDIRPWR